MSTATFATLASRMKRCAAPDAALDIDVYHALVRAPDRSTRVPQYTLSARSRQSTLAMLQRRAKG